MANGVERAERYIKRCIDKTNNIPQSARLAAKRHIKDKKNKALRWDKDAANNAIDNIELFVHARGEKQGQPICLEDWQCFAVASIFGWKWKQTNKRRFRYAYIQVPRKNGKSLLAISVGLNCFALDDEKGAEVYLGATTEAHARDLLFYPARYIAANTPGFVETCGIELNASNLSIQESFSKLKSVIRKPDDGANPHCAIIDEYHEHPDDEQWATFNTGMGARTQPLLFVITTAGWLLGGPCKNERDECFKILTGALQVDSKFALIYEPDEGADWNSPETLESVNPNIDVSISRQYLLDQLHQASLSAEKQNAFRTKHLNQWVGARVAWMNILKWQRQARRLNLEEFEGCTCYMALDLAAKIDLAAQCLLFEKDEKLYAFFRFWAPEDADNDRYLQYSLTGDLQLTPGPRTDFDLIAETIDEDCKRFNVSIVGFDPHQANQMMVELDRRGVNVAEYPQSVKTLSEPMKQVEALIYDSVLFHDGNACMLWQVGNVVARKDAKDQIYPRKEFENNPNCKIDGAVALIMAMGLQMKESQRHRSYLEGSEVITV